MNFSFALEYLKLGIPMRRSVWKPDRRIIVANRECNSTIIQMMIDKSNTGEQVWVQLSDDLLSNDWVIAK